MTTSVNKVLAARVLAKYAILIYLTQDGRDSFSLTTLREEWRDVRHLSATIVAKNTLWMCVALAAGILAAWLMVVLAKPTKRAEAAFPGNNGKIAFMSSPESSDSEIVTMKPNGDDKTQLTNNQTCDALPAFSPNGKKIAFISCRSGNGDIYTMSANGTHQKRVTRSESDDSYPAWSPNGTRIAFSRERNGDIDIYVINQDGSGLTRLTTSPQSDFNPAWSPDGTRIAFVRRASGNSENPKIYVMKAAPESETNIPQRLTTSSDNTLFESDPAWSPDGTRIAYYRLLDGVSNIYAIRPDGSDQIRLTNNLLKLVGAPAWSPDGTKIVFSGMTRVPRVRNIGIYVMKAAPQSPTNSPKRLTGDRDNSFQPDWQPLR
jgi:Tol biopolymer transport system component